MRNPLFAATAAAALALSTGAAGATPAPGGRAAHDVAPRPTAESAQQRTARIGDRPDPARWRAIRCAARAGLPTPPEGCLLAVLDDRIVTLDAATGRIVGFVTL